MSQSSEPTPHEPAPAQALEHLAHLRKMSATAGVALGEYRAVSVPAVVSLVLGVASWMSQLHVLMYLLPLGAIALGLAAFVQIRRSNGTQSGLPLAAIGVVLAVCLGGWALTGDLSSHNRAEKHRGEIRRMIGDFGAALAQSDYDDAYRFMASNFQSEVSAEQFRDQLSVESQRLGGVRSARTNELVRVTEDSEGRVTAEAIMMAEIGYPEPLRQQVVLVREEGEWRIREFESWFPRAGRPRRAR